MNPLDGRLCDVCHERPAAVEVLFVSGGEQRPALLCERCARRAMAAQRGGTLDGELLGGQAQPGWPSAAGGPAVRQHRQAEPRSATPALDKFGRDLTAEGRAGRIDPVIGRETEIEQVVEVLTRRRKNNAVLIGEAGVGKT